ncbi:MAG: hypothetical protein N3A71_02995 [Candidatus Dojkabacteria bacterium]|nr:hypothetical protein [Candidatus Dojkabacteria bacterium]
MKVGIICNKKNKTINRISEELEKLGHECYRLYLKDFIFSIENNENFTISHRKKEINDIDIFFFKFNTDNHSLQSILEFIESRNKKVINGQNTTYLTNFYLFHALVRNHIKVINLYHTAGLRAARDVLIDLEHPIMILPFEGKETRAEISDDWTESFDVVKSEKIKIFDFLEIPENIYKTGTYNTSIIVNNKIIFNAEVSTKDKLLWASTLKKYKTIEPTETTVNQLQNIMSLLELDICQIDFYIDENSNEIIVLNISLFPSIYSIENKFKVNLAREIAEFIVSK